MIDDLQAKDALLKRIIGDHEPAYAQQWRGLSEAYASDMLKRIIAFRLHIEQLDSKIKLNQHRPESHQQMAAQLALGGDHERALRDWMIELGMVKP
jgi:transcriptional regulator